MWISPGLTSVSGLPDQTSLTQSSGVTGNVWCCSASLPPFLPVCGRRTRKAISHTAGSDAQWFPARSQGLAQHTAWNQELIRLTFRDLTGSAPPQIRLLYIWKVFWACWESCDEISSSWPLRTSPYLRAILKITALYWHLWFHEERFTSK